MPFLAAAALPLKVSSARSSSVTEVRVLRIRAAFVIPRAEQRDLCQRLGLIVPTFVGSAYQLTIVTPRVGERVVIGRVVPIESEPCGLAEEMGADECFLWLTVGRTLDTLWHLTLSSRENRLVSTSVPEWRTPCADCIRLEALVASSPIQPEIVVFAQLASQSLRTYCSVAYSAGLEDLLKLSSGSDVFTRSAKGWRLRPTKISPAPAESN